MVSYLFKNEKKQSKSSYLTPEDFYFISNVHDPQVSPDGKMIAYVLQTVDRVNNAYNNSIWLVPSSGGTPKKFTQGGKGGDTSPRWSPDGTKIAFLSNRNGNKNQIFIIEVDGGEARQLTNCPNGVASEPVWSPDGKAIAFLSRVNEEERKKEEEELKKKKEEEEFKDYEILKIEKEKEELLERRKFDPRVITRMVFRAGTEFRDGRRQHIYIQNLEEDKPRRITEGDYDFTVPAWSKDGEFIITSANFTENEDDNIAVDLVKIPAKGGKMTFLTRSEDADMMPRVTPDGQYVVFFRFSAYRLFEQRSEIWRVNISGKEPPEPLLKDRDMDVQLFHLSSCGKWIYFTTAIQGNNLIYRIPIDGGDPRPVVTGNRFIEEFHTAAETVAYRSSSPLIPSDIYVSDLEGKKELRLTEVNKKFLSEKILSQLEEFWFTNANGDKIQGWIMKPPDFKKGKKYPLAVEIHGGPHIMWGNEFWHEFQCIAARQYVVFFCNPRGSDGYGHKFKGSIYRAWGEKVFEDIMTGVDRVCQLDYVDGSKMAITGGSFGGYMTTWMVSHTNRFKAAVTQRGVYNLFTLYGGSDALLLLDWDFGTFGYEEPELLLKLQPVTYAKNIQTPLLILHSENDYRTPICTADELFVLLKKYKKEVQFVRYPREGHELSRSGEPWHRVDRINRIIDWFDKYIKNK